MYQLTYLQKLADYKRRKRRSRFIRRLRSMRRRLHYRPYLPQLLLPDVIDVINKAANVAVKQLPFSDNNGVLPAPPSDIGGVLPGSDHQVPSGKHKLGEDFIKSNVTFKPKVRKVLPPAPSFSPGVVMTNGVSPIQTYNGYSAVRKFHLSKPHLRAVGIFQTNDGRVYAANLNSGGLYHVDDKSGGSLRDLVNHADRRWNSMDIFVYNPEKVGDWRKVATLMSAGGVGKYGVFPTQHTTENEIRSIVSDGLFPFSLDGVPLYQHMFVSRDDMVRALINGKGERVVLDNGEVVSSPLIRNSYVTAGVNAAMGNFDEGNVEVPVDDNDILTADDIVDEHANDRF